MLSLCFSIEQLFKEMASSEPVLKIAVSRGGQDAGPRGDQGQPS